MQQKIFVGTTNGLLRGEVGDGGSVAMPGLEVSSLARRDGEWWAIVDSAEVWRSGGNDDWARVASAGEYRANCLSTTSSGLLAGMSDARLFALKGESLEPVSAFDETPGHQDWYTALGRPARCPIHVCGPGPATSTRTCTWVE